MEFKPAFIAQEENKPAERLQAVFKEEFIGPDLKDFPVLRSVNFRDILQWEAAIRGKLGQFFKVPRFSLMPLVDERIRPYVLFKMRCSLEEFNGRAQNQTVEEQFMMINESLGPKSKIEKARLLKAVKLVLPPRGEPVLPQIVLFLGEFEVTARALSEKTDSLVPLIAGILP